jgi:hypothetical protein
MRVSCRIRHAYHTKKATGEGTPTHPPRKEAKWGHSPKSWGNGGNIPLFPGLGECVGMGGMAILPLK